MTPQTTASPTQPGFVHQAAFFGSDEGLLELALPYVEEGRLAGEPLLVFLSDHNAEVLRRRLPEDADVTLVDGGAQYSRPATTIRAFIDRFTAHVEAGPGRLRVLGEVLDASVAPWEPWARYEAAINEIFAPFPVTGRCVYDVRTTPSDVLSDVVRTHPYLAIADGKGTAHRRFQAPASFLASRTQPAFDPLQDTPPAVELFEATPAEARVAVAALARRTSLGDDDVGGLILGVSEVVANGHEHGLGPVVLRAWSAPDRVVVVVTDQGTGPADPFTGLIPPNGAMTRPSPDTGGRGMWIAHQMCAQVVQTTTSGGYTVHLTGGTPACPSPGHPSTATPASRAAD